MARAHVRLPKWKTKERKKKVKRCPTSISIDLYQFAIPSLAIDAHFNTSLLFQIQIYPLATPSPAIKESVQCLDEEAAESTSAFDWSLSFG